ncbi:MAG: cytochrome C oxidase subunit IV family protein [Acidimicrobiales bacterium]
MSDTETTEPSGHAPHEAGEPGPVVKTDEHEGGTGHAHPTEKDYIKVAIFLGVITALEVVVYLVESLEGVLPYILVTMSIVKFATVVLWFMHLRFDSRLFRRLFVTGMLLAVFVYGIALTTLHAWSQ